MTVIFKHFPDKETIIEILSYNNFFKRVFGFIKNNKILMRISSLCLIGMMAVGVSIVSVGITLGLKVNYAGAFIATVKNSGVFDDAKDIAVDHIESSNADKVIETPKFSMTLMSFAQ